MSQAPDERELPREHHLNVTRAARYFMLGSPSPEVRECWFVLHGYGQLAGRFLRHFTSVRLDRRLIVAPEALSRFYLGSDPARHAQARVGASWMSREDRLAEISDYVGYLDALWTTVAEGFGDAEVTLGVLGFSQGAATACRWTALGAAPVRRLVLWGGAVPDDVDPEMLRRKLGEAVVECVIGDSDRFRSADVLAAQLDRLRSRSVSCAMHSFSGGHILDEELLARLMDTPSGPT